MHGVKVIHFKIDQEEKGEKVIQRGDQLFLVNSGALISEMHVIRASGGRLVTI